MEITQLQFKWNDLSENSLRNGFKALRISSECLSDTYIGVNQEANRCLILSLPTDYELDFKGIVKENLKIEFFKETRFIVLQLTDNSYYDLFDDLIISLYQRIKDISDVREYSKEFIQTFFKWSEFFEDKRNSLLSENALKGLIGELLILKSLVFECAPGRINDTLASWKGPYDKGHDFELEVKDLEVKTKYISGIEIGISSEYQLEKAFDKGLELIVISLENDLIAGLSIGDIISEIRKMITEKLGDSSILLKALNQKGLTFKNLLQYESFKFRPVNKVIYNCNSAAFPKLIRSDIPEEINSVCYNIRLSSLTKFIISTQVY